jgi:predicted HTH domain antitoxin
MNISFPGGGQEMSSTVAIEIPPEVVHATRMSLEELRQELALHLFQQGKLSFGKAKEMSGMTFWAFQQLLGARGIPVHYGVEDYEEDLEVLEKLGAFNGCVGLIRAHQPCAHSETRNSSRSLRGSLHS